MSDITLILDAISRGERGAAEELLPLVYAELRNLATARMLRESGGDTQHFWPYNWNQDSEQAYPERVVGMVGALRRDLGLSDMTTGYAPGTYRLRNRSTAKLLDTDGSNTNSAPVKEYSASGSVDQQWNLSLIAGTTYFTLQSVANGKFLDSLGNTNAGSAIGLSDGSGSANQKWQVRKTDAGFYQIVNVGTGKALDTGGQDFEGAGMQGWLVNPSWNQQWKFVHVTPAAKPVGLISQSRSVTTNYTDATVSNGTRYYYVVSATSLSGESTNSTQASVLPTSTAPVTLSMSATGGVLNFSWPADHTGWRLQVQTNSLGTNWSTVASSPATNNVLIPISGVSPISVFYRLIYP